MNVSMKRAREYAPDFDSVIDRSGTGSVKWECMREADPSVPDGTMPFWIADMDFACPAPLLDSMRRRIDRLIFGYSSNQTAEYFDAVQGWFERRFHWKIPSESIMFSPGVVPALGYLIDILSEPGDGVIIQSPVYYPFARTIENHARKVVDSSLVVRNGRYEMNVEDMVDKAIRNSAKILLLCSPHNPVGRVWREDELRNLRPLLENTDVIIVSDEIHCDLVRCGVTHTPLETIFPEYKHRIITATAPSKTFNIAGLQLSNIVIHDAMIRAEWRKYVIGRLGLKRPNAMAIVAAESAYSECEAWVESLKEYLDSNFEFMEEFIKRYIPKAAFKVPEGTYLAWVDMNAYTDDDVDLVRHLTTEGRVFVEAGSAFGTEGKGFIRMNIACPRSLLEEGLRRISSVL